MTGGPFLPRELPREEEVGDDEGDQVHEPVPPDGKAGNDFGLDPRGVGNVRQHAELLLSLYTYTFSTILPCTGSKRRVIIFFSVVRLVAPSVALEDRAGVQRAPDDHLRRHVLVVAVPQRDEAHLALLDELHRLHLLRPGARQRRRRLGLRGDGAGGHGRLRKRASPGTNISASRSARRFVSAVTSRSSRSIWSFTRKSWPKETTVRTPPGEPMFCTSTPRLARTSPADEDALLRVQLAAAVALHLAADAGAVQVDVTDGQEDGLLGEHALDVPLGPAGSPSLRP